MQECSVAHLNVVNKDNGNSFHEKTELGNGEKIKKKISHYKAFEDYDQDKSIS